MERGQHYLTGTVLIMAGERELTTGLLVKDASFRLIVRQSRNIA